MAKTDELMAACNLFLNEVSKIDELFISFDSSRALVEIMWHEFVFKVPVNEVEMTLECIEFLNHREEMVIYKRESK
mgnify:CR=1 FL=1